MGVLRHPLSSMSNLSLPEPLQTPGPKRLWTPGSRPLDRPPGISRAGVSRLRCCCVDCDCACEHASGTVSCCMNVHITGMVGLGGSCTNLMDCLDYNQLYSLYRSTPDDAGNCVWKCPWTPRQNCDATDIIATLYLDGSDYKLKVELGGHIWEKNFGTSKPDMCNTTIGALAHQADTGSCDSSSATCTVTMVDGDGTCSCVIPCGGCDVPPEIMITIPDGLFIDKVCSDCDVIIGGNYITSAFSRNAVCIWTYSEIGCGGDATLQVQAVKLAAWPNSIRVTAKYARTSSWFTLVNWDLTDPISCEDFLAGDIPSLPYASQNIQGSDNAPCDLADLPYGDATITIL